MSDMKSGNVEVVSVIDVELVDVIVLYKDVDYIIFVCDVGMGLFVMGVFLLWDKVKKVGISMFVINMVISNLKDEFGLLVIM